MVPFHFHTTYAHIHAHTLTHAYVDMHNITEEGPLKLVCGLPPYRNMSTSVRGVPEQSYGSYLLNISGESFCGALVHVLWGFCEREPIGRNKSES